MASDAAGPLRVASGFTSRGGRSYLETRPIKPVVQADYRHQYHAFLAFAARHRLPLRLRAQMDGAILEYLDHLFFEGWNLADGTKLLAAVRHHYPAFRLKIRCHSHESKGRCRAGSAILPQDFALLCLGTQ